VYYDRVNYALTLCIYNSECGMTDLIFVWTFEVSLRMLREVGAENSISTDNYYFERNFSPSQWSRGLRRVSAAVRLLELRFQIPPLARMFVSCECFVLRYLRRGDHTSRGDLLTVVRRCVWSRKLKIEEVMAHFGPQRHGNGNLISCAMTNSVEYETHWVISNH